MAASASVAAPTVYDALLEDSGGEDDHRARSPSPKSVIERVHGVFKFIQGGSSCTCLQRC